MRIALMADLHSNRQALAACLAHARGRGAERFVFLGDLVGYGADPAWVVETVMRYADEGAAVVQGNHDRAVADERESMSVEAEYAVSWTRRQLGLEARDFLASLPMRREDDSRLYVHAHPQTYPAWLYVDDSAAAERALGASRAQAVFCGHVHTPALYGINAAGRTVAFQPIAGVAVPLPRHRRWLAVIGSVGQPRDGNPAACYAMLDSMKGELTFLRVPYDVAGAAARIRAAGLPDSLAERLRNGR